jgi:hypothetical protein
MEEMDLPDIYGVFHSTATDCTFFSSHGTCSKICHKGHKANINKYKNQNNTLYPNRQQWNKIRHQ